MTADADALVVYTRAVCPQSDHVVLALELLRSRLCFTYSKVDIDSDPDLCDRYGTRIPVVTVGDREVCAGNCDPAVLERQIRAFFDRAR